MQPQSPPGTTEYEVSFTAEDFMRVRIRTERGRGVVAVIAQHEATIDETIDPVVGYDSSHGQAHRDLLDVEGRNIDKLWYSRSISYAEVVDRAIADIRANWEQYREDFIGRMP